jgi:hypothetical protein
VTDSLLQALSDAEKDIETKQQEAESAMLRLQVK